MHSKSQSGHTKKTVREHELIHLRRAIEKHCHRNRKTSCCRGYTHRGEVRLASQNKHHSSHHPITSKTQHHPAHNTASTWLGYIIRHERRRQNLTQSQLTAALQFGTSALSTIENGRALANIERTFRVVRYLQLDVATTIIAVHSQLTFHMMLQGLRRQEAAAHDHFHQETPQIMPQWKARVAEEPLDRPYGLREP